MTENEVLDTLLEKRDRIQDRIIALGDKKKEIDEEVKKILGKPQKVTIGKHYIAWTETTTNRLDTKRIKAELPEVAEKYTIQSRGERLTISVRKSV